jgi:hypothetical protein
MTTGRIVELLDKNKAYAAFLAPLLTAVAAAVASWIVTGNWSDTELRAAAGGVVLAVASALATYLTPAGAATVDATVPRPAIHNERGYSLVEVLAALFIGLLIVIVFLALLDRL